MIGEALWALGWLIAGAANSACAGRSLEAKSYGRAGVNLFMVIVAIIYVAKYAFR